MNDKSLSTDLAKSRLWSAKKKPSKTILLLHLSFFLLLMSFVNLYMNYKLIFVTDDPLPYYVGALLVSSIFIFFLYWTYRYFPQLQGVFVIIGLPSDGYSESFMDSSKSALLSSRVFIFNMLFLINVLGIKWLSLVSGKEGFIGMQVFEPKNHVLFDFSILSMIFVSILFFSFLSFITYFIESRNFNKLISLLKAYLLFLKH